MKVSKIKKNSNQTNYFEKTSSFCLFSLNFDINLFSILEYLNIGKPHSAAFIFFCHGH